ncbi:MAG: quinoprotein relay system zinc metallohydrolase 2 [Steroidobacteraceae bacterium]|jgi:quinoprotein relay system zinc metallohydrolase 2
MAAIVDGRPVRSAIAPALCGSVLLACATGPGAVVAAQTRDGFNLSAPQPGLYVHLGKTLPLDAPGHDDIANIGFIIGSKCVAVIDTGGSVRIGRQLRAAIRRRTSLPICYVIDTHVHVDHVLGNFAFKADKPRIVGHAALADAMARNRQYFMSEYGGDFDGAPSAEQIMGPDQAVDRELSLDLGGRTLRLRAWPTAHTDCDLTVYDERTGTLWAGDLLFRERLPALDGNLKGWLAAIDDLSRMKVRFVVPGHGSLTSDLGGSLDREREYLTALYDGVRSELAQGQSMRDAIDKVAVAQRDRWALWPDVHPRNVARAYEELQWE